MYQQQLPFNPEGPQAQYLNLSLNNPPHVPRYNGDPQIQQVVPFVAAATAMEIQNNSQKNPLRMFMFNQYGQNNFANQDFDALVVAILDFMTLGMMKRQYNNLEHAAQDAVPKMVEMLAAVNLKLFPPLERYIDQQLVYVVRNTIQCFDQVAMEIGQMKQQMSGGYRQPNNNFGGGGGYPPSNQFGNNGGFNTGRPMVSSSNGGTSLFAGNNNMAPVNTARPIGGSKYSGNNNNSNRQSNWGAADEALLRPEPTIKQPFIPRDNKMTQNNMQPPSAAVSITKEVLAAGSGIKWKPLAKQPYFPAFNPLVQDLYYIVDNNNVILEAILKEKKERVMDYNRHVISTVFGPTPVKANYNPAAITNIEVGVTNINKATELLNGANAETVDPVYTSMVKKEIVADTCIESAWFYGAINRMQATLGETPYVYRAYASIASPVISFVDETDVVESFGKSDTYVELADKLNSSINNINPELWTLANRKATDHINRMLKQNMSIPGLSIESFASDIKDLIALLTKKYGETIQEIFLKTQKNYIEATFRIVDESVADNMTANFLELEGDMKITYLASDYSLTFLDCNSRDLELELAEETGAIVNKAVTPVIHALLVGLFADVEAHGGTFDRNLIRTNDGRVLEATRGALNPEFMLLTLIK